MHHERRRLFDSHFHITDPRFPLRANRGFVPSPFTVDDYRARTASFALMGGAVVSGSFQGFDQTYLIDALQRLGPGFVGVTQLPPSVGDGEISALAEVGVRAVRFNLHRGGSPALEDLETMARRVHEPRCWHVELYLDSADLPDLAPRLVGLPRVVIDHLGLTPTGFDTLVKLVERGVHVKASGFGRVTLDVASALTALCDANPQAIVFGTDLPSTRAKRPFRDSDVDLILDCLGDEVGRLVLLENGLHLYGLG